MNQNLCKLFSAAAAFAVLSVGCSTAGVSSDQSSSEPSETMQTAGQQPGPDRNPMDTQTIPEDIPTVLLSEESPSPASDLSALFTDRDRRDTYDTPIAVITCTGDAVSIDGTGASADGTDITITEEGVYRITGTLNDGQIIVNSEGKIQLILDNADLSCADCAPIYIRQAKKCFLTLAEGSENSVSDAAAYIYENETDNEPDAAIFSADTLTINGGGTLTVSGNYNDGITCKDDLIITSGSIRVNAVGNGIKGKDYIAIAGGDISVTAGADGIKSNNTDAGTGFVYIEGGTIMVDAQEDAIQAESECILTGGKLHLKAGGGSANAQPQMHQSFGGGRENFGSWDEYDETADDTAVSTKALKAGTLVYITGGECVMDSADDGLHSNADLYIGGGTLEIAAGGDGIHADGLADIADGSICVTKSSEGIEAAGIRISGGTVEVTAADDGCNASDGTAQGGMGTYTSGAALEISGGSIYVNADGDGLDSNGDLLISGGTVIVDGPTNSGNGALDGNGNIWCTGGTVIAAGSSGMAEYPRGSQNTAIITLDTSQQSGTVIRIADASGKELLSHAPAKQFDSFIVSCPDFKDGEAYTVTANDREIGTFTAESVLSYIGEAGRGVSGGNFGGGRGDGGGHGNRHDMQMPENMQIPTDENGNPMMPEMPQGGMTPPDGGFRGRMPENFVVQ